MDFAVVDSRTKEIVAPLTAAQREAVCHRDGPLLILAGPGSGKTRVVTHRIASLGQSIPARQIVALTFTNKAADEMRVAPGAVGAGAGGVGRDVSPVLLAALAAVRPAGGPGRELLDLRRRGQPEAAARSLAAAGLKSDYVLRRTIAEEISRAKNNLLAAEEYVARPGRACGTLVQQVYPAYQRRLLAANAVDFDDLLLHVAVLLRENPELRRTLDERYRYILVDEYQDTNFAQYAIVRALVAGPSPSGGDGRPGPVDLRLARRRIWRTSSSSSTTFPTCTSFAWRGTTAARSGSCAWPIN